MLGRAYRSVVLVPAAPGTAERILAGRFREFGDARADLTGLPMRIVD